MRNRTHGCIWSALIVALSISTPARAELSLSWGGKLQSDIRLRVASKEVGRFYNRQVLPTGVARNENIFKLKLDAEVGPVRGVVDLDFVWVGYSHDFDGISDLSLREEVDPFRIEAHAAFIEAADLFVKGLDLRVGQQLVLWGVGDQFNPTNTLNANDVEDPLLFGEQQANLMLKVDYAPGDNWIFSAVLVPLFKPALVPDSAVFGLANADRIPMTRSDLRYRLHTEKAFTHKGLGYPTIVAGVEPVLPERSLENMQGALRVAGSVGDHDIAVSYYTGRTDFPQPYMNYSRATTSKQCAPPEPGQPQECINGLLVTDVTLGYPRLQVVGLNVAGSVNALGWISDKISPIGYRMELGLYIPQAASIALLQDNLSLGGIARPAGEYDYTLGQGGPNIRPNVVDDRVFAKWVLGLDYTFNEHLYLNVQWVHGMVDEYGAGDFIRDGHQVRKVEVAEDPVGWLGCAMSGVNCERYPTEFLSPRLGDYLVAGLDIKLLSQRLLLRMFTIFGLNGVQEDSWDKAQKKRVRKHHNAFTSEGFTAVIYPELQYNVGHGLELHLGALIMLGKEHTKFGDPASGGTQIFTRARFSF